MIKGQQRAPQTITLDGYAASYRAVREPKADGSLPNVREAALIEDAPNNLIERDHRGVNGSVSLLMLQHRLQGLPARGDHDRRH